VVAVLAGAALKDARGVAAVLVLLAGLWLAFFFWLDRKERR
jgi:hypothetical protein